MAPIRPPAKVTPKATPNPSPSPAPKPSNTPSRVTANPAVTAAASAAQSKAAAAARAATSATVTSAKTAKPASKPETKPTVTPSARGAATQAAFKAAEQLVQAKGIYSKFPNQQTSINLQQAKKNHQSAQDARISPELARLINAEAARDRQRAKENQARQQPGKTQKPSAVVAVVAVAVEALKGHLKKFHPMWNLKNQPLLLEILGAIQMMMMMINQLQKLKT